MNERTDNNAKTTAVPSEPLQPVGFPWLLVIQIVLAIISYLIRRTPALAASDRSYLFDLKHKLEAGFPEVRAD